MGAAPQTKFSRASLVTRIFGASLAQNGACDRHALVIVGMVRIILCSPCAADAKKRL